MNKLLPWTTLFAEAAIDLHPWDFWTNGLPQPWTHEILETLERALRIDPKQSGSEPLLHSRRGRLSQSAAGDSRGFDFAITAGRWTGR
jgi:hypothetical protein